MYSDAYNTGFIPHSVAYYPLLWTPKNQQGTDSLPYPVVKSVSPSELHLPLRRFTPDVTVGPMTSEQRKSTSRNRALGSASYLQGETYVIGDSDGLFSLVGSFAFALFWDTVRGRR